MENTEMSFGLSENKLPMTLSKMRLVCTDQLGITHPAAVNRAIADGVKIRNFDGRVTYVFPRFSQGAKSNRFDGSFAERWQRFRNERFTVVESLPLLKLTSHESLFATVSPGDSPDYDK